MVTTWLYFGLKFYRAKLTTKKRLLGVTKKILLTCPPSWLDRNQFQIIVKAIESDIYLLNQYGIKITTKGQWLPNGSFHQIHDYVWIYEHTTHATPSSTDYSQISSFFSVSVGEEDIRLCLDSSHHHFKLNSFFYSNRTLSGVVNKILSCSPDTSIDKVALQQYKDSFESCKENTKDDEGPFAFKYNFWDCTFDIDENTWMKRLVGALKEYLPDLRQNISFTANKGPEFKSSLEYYSSVRNIHSHSNISPFQGSPDILIHHSVPVQVAGEDESPMANENDMGVSSPSMTDSGYLAFEVTKQQNKCNVKYDSMPEKVGELLGNMWWIAVSCILKRQIVKGKTVDETSVKGLFVDKSHGTIELIATFCINGFEDEVPVQHRLHIDGPAGSGVLSPESLCSSLLKILGNPSVSSCHK